MTVSEVPVPAHRLMLGDVGRTVESIVYGSRRGKSKPSRTWNGEKWVAGRQRYTIQSIYIHENGTILINQNGYKIYLRRDTDVYFVHEEEESTAL